MRKLATWLTLALLAAPAGCDAGRAGPPAAPPAPPARAPRAGPECVQAVQAAQLERRADAAIAQGRLLRGARALERATELCSEPSRSAKLVRLLVTLGERARVEALAQSMLADTRTRPLLEDDARAALASVKARATVEADARTSELEALLRQAAAALASGDPAGARASYETAFAEGDRDGRALYGAGFALQLLGNDAEARRFFDRALVQLKQRFGRYPSAADAPDFGRSPAWVSPTQLRAGDWLVDWSTREARRVPERSILSPDLEWMVTLDDGVRVCRMPDCRAPRQISDTEDEHVFELLFTEDGKRLFVVASAHVEGFEVGTWTATTLFSTWGLGASLSQDGARAAFLAFSHPSKKPVPDKVTFWDVAAGTARGHARGRFAQGLVYAPSGSIALLPSGDELLLLRGHDGKPLARLRDASVVELSPAGDALVVARGEQLLLLDATTGRSRATLPGDVEQLPGAAFSPDGSLLALATSGSVQLIDVRTGSLRRQLALEDQARALSFLGSDAVAAWTRGRASVRLWSLAGAGAPRVLTAPAPLRDVAPSADGRLVAAVAGAPAGPGRLAVWTRDGRTLFEAPARVCALEDRYYPIELCDGLGDD